MNQENFNKMVQDFFEALRRKTLLIIIDSASKNEKAVFTIVSFSDGKYIRYSPMLAELGFKECRKDVEYFITYCAGRFSLYILDNIGGRLRGRGVELPDDFYNLIQYQHHI